MVSLASLLVWRSSRAARLARASLLSDLWRPPKAFQY